MGRVLRPGAHPPRPLIAQDQRDSRATADDVRPGAQPGISPVLPPGVMLCRKREALHMDNGAIVCVRTGHKSL